MWGYPIIPRVCECYLNYFLVLWGVWKRDSYLGTTHDCVDFYLILRVSRINVWNRGSDKQNSNNLSLSGRQQSA